MNILKSPNSKIKALSQRKKSKDFKTHMRNFNKQYFDMQQEKRSTMELSARSFYKSSNSVFFVVLLGITVLLYIFMGFFYEKMISTFFYDIWLDIHTLLRQSGY